MWGEGCFQEVWNKTSGDGPLISFKKLLGQLSRAADGSSAADSFRAGGPEWQSKPLALAKLDEALQHTDLEKVSRRPGLQEAASIDVPAVRAIAGRMAGQGLREAYESVLVGDMVVRGITKHWQEHDGTCQCGLEEETVEHVFWRCPR